MDTAHGETSIESDRSALPLQGIRVLELGNYIAAPTAGRLLADFGAEVIKVERPRTGDELRNWRLYAGTTSLLFRTINRNKKSIVVDLRTDAGRDVIRQLVALCDVVIENFRPGTLERWGLAPSELKRVNPDVVTVRISAFGQTGPMASQPGFAAVAEAHGGLRALVGEPDRPPSRVGVSIADSIAGIYAGFGAVMALYAREARRRQGVTAEQSDAPETIIDVALSESVLSVTESLVPDYLAYKVERPRLGGRVEGIAPSNAYLCGDGSSVVIAGNGDAIFKRFMATIARPDLGEDPGLASNAQRWERRDELDDAIGTWTAQYRREEVLAQLSEVGVPAGAIYTAADIVNDEQYLARNMIQSLAVDPTGDGVAQQIDFPGIVPVIGPRSLGIRSAGPDLGEHTEQILGGLLKLDPDQIAAAAGAAAHGLAARSVSLTETSTVAGDLRALGSAGMRMSCTNRSRRQVRARPNRINELHARGLSQGQGIHAIPRRAQPRRGGLRRILVGRVDGLAQHAAPLRMLGVGPTSSGAPEAAPRDRVDVRVPASGSSTRGVLVRPHNQAKHVTPIRPE